jgi:PilZ domain-containing protein
MSGHPDPPRHGHRIRLGVHAEVSDGKRTVACEAQNLSRSGVLLVGDLQTPVASMVDLALRSPTGSLTLRLAARVIRVEPNPHGEGVRTALEFVDLDESRRDAIEVFVARLLEAPVAGLFDHLKPDAAPQEIKRALEAIPLPQRISMSSRAPLKDREILRLDTHPAVLEALARNPNLSLTEARGLATSRYLSHGTLDGLSNDARFKDDEELRMAVATHPRVSLVTAEKVTADFKVPQIKKLLAKPGLNQVLREKLLRRSQR